MSEEVKVEILTKVCKKCKIEKEFSGFDYFKSRCKFSSRCKACRRAYEREFNARRREKLGLKPIIKRPSGSVSEEQKHQEMLETCRRYRARHPERRRKSAREWARRNREKQQERWRHKYKTDIIFNIKTKIRRRIYMALSKAKKGARKADRTIKLLGCSFAEFKTYIEKLLLPGMKWEDVMTSKVHLDHIIPCSAFDLTKEEEQRKCFHFTNLQPLWATSDIAEENNSDQIGNLNKSTKIIGVDFHEVLI